MKSDWILCSDRLPVVGEKCIISDGDNIRIAFLTEHGHWDDGEWKDYITDITHWQELPELPLKEKNDD